MLATIATLIASLLIALTVHEAAHALALRTFGVPISRAGLGLPFPPVWTVPARGRRTFALTVSPWLVGAYVQADERQEERLDALPYRDKAWHLNAGIVANLILGFGMLAISAAATGRPLRAAVLTVLAAACWFGRRILAAYVAPAVAVPALVFMGWALAQSWADGETGAGYAGLVDLVPSGVVGAVEFVGVISISIAILNALPLFGLDNGRVVDLLLSRWLGRRAVTAYRGVGMALVAASLLLAIGSDVWSAFTAITN